MDKEFQMKVLKIGVLVLALLVSQSLFAQEDVQENNGLLNYYGTELFQWSYDFWGGLNLNYQNQSSKTMFGLKDTMQKALASYDDTNQMYLSYKKKTLLGNVFFWSGYAALLSSPFILAYGSWEGGNYNRPAVNTAWAVFGGGLVSVLVSSFIFSSGQENIFDAVNVYNRNKLSDYEK
jgi:hypothetical protein